jgi:hypothetical protein
MSKSFNPSAENLWLRSPVLFGHKTGNERL